MGKEKVFIYSHSKGNIDYYNVNPKVTVKIKSINLETGEIEKKKITQYTIHKNLEMYKIHDPKKRFEDFWASSDHSLIVYESETKKYIKISPLKIKENPEKYQLIKDVLYGKMFIPCNEIKITYDPNVTEAGDLTVEDNYTFATHDGIFVQDTVALYRPVTEKAIKETEQKLWTKNNIFSAANMEVQFKAKQGIVYGIYKLTKSKIGRELFKQSLNLDYDITEPVTSKKLSQIIQEECKKGNIDILDKVKLLGFSTTIASPETISILDLEPMDVKLTGDKEKDSEVLSNSLQKLKETFPKKDIIESGARASWDQVKQMVTARGYISDFFGNIINVPIKSCYAKGLSSEDFFISSYGARKGILDVAENTAKSGYLTRKMVYGGISSQLDLNLDDCGTEYCVEVNVYSMDLAKSLLGRYYYENLDSEELKCVENPEDILHKSIFLRTPLLCQSKKICKKCYGKLSEVHKSPFIGVIAAQTLGERSVQLVLRTFHLCIRKNTKILTINNEKMDAIEVYNRIKNGETIYTFSTSPEGNIVVSKFTDAHRHRLVKKAIKVTLDNGESVVCTHDHKWILRNGKEIRADELQVGDSLMPIYIDESSDYRTVIQNDNLKKERIYKIASRHSDVEIDPDLGIQRCSQIQIHHKDRNKRNDYPTNLLVTTTFNHIQLHVTEDLIERRRYEMLYDPEVRNKMSKAVSESNKRRMKDPEFKKKFITKVLETWDENLRKETGQKVSEFYKQHPDIAKHVGNKARETMIKQHVQYIKSLNIPLTNENYDSLRQSERIPTFKFAKEKYPDLVKEFIEIQGLTKHQKECLYKLQKSVELSKENFDIVTIENCKQTYKQLYPAKNSAKFETLIKNVPYNYLPAELIINHKVVKVEEIEFDEPEYFYDFTVDSEYHNFALGCGVFIHNSGVAQSKKLGKQEDIVSDMENTINSIDRDIPVKDVTEAFEKTLDMWELFKQYGYLHLVHFEVITSQRLWAELDDKFIRYRTNIQNLEKFETYNEDGEIIDTEYTLKMIGVKNIASLESWFLGMIFQNIRQNFIKGVLHESSETSILEKIVMGQII